MLDSLVLGIDFGTTNSVISYFNKKHNCPEVIKDGIDTLIPTRVYVGEKKYFGNHIPDAILKSSKIIENFKTNIPLEKSTENSDHNTIQSIEIESLI